MSERSEQIETLARKIMGWMPYVTEITLGSWQHADGSGFAARPNWNPFTSPADCEMLKAKLGEMGNWLTVRLRGGNDVECELTTNIYEGASAVPVYYVGHGDTEYKAVCDVALKLPECLPDTTPAG